MSGCAGDRDVERFRWMVYRNRRSPDGHPVWAFGLRVGYWPCLKGPFIAVAVGTVSLDFWHGLGSYKTQRRS